METSDHLFRGAGFEISVTSTDWETPAVSRNWAWNGQEIDVGFYQNVSLVSALGDEPAFMANVAPGGSHLFQDSSTSTASANGGGQNFASSDGASGAFFGEEGEYQNVGGFTNFVLAPFTTVFNPSFTYLPTALNSGQYDLRAWTYGYFQAIPVSVFAQPGQMANARIPLVIGVSLSIDLTFAKEQLAVPLPDDTSARIRFFDERGRLVAEWMSSEGDTQRAGEPSWRLMEPAALPSERETESHCRFNKLRACRVDVTACHYSRVTPRSLRRLQDYTRFLRRSSFHKPRGAVLENVAFKLRRE